MNITVRHFCAKGEIISPPSKSGSHRALVAAALSDGRTLVKNLLSSDDITATAGALSALGARVETGERSAVVYPGGRGDRIARINCNESGTTARFILPLSAYLATETVITGRGRLPERPFAPLCSAMRSRGTELSSDFLPITVKGGLHSGVYEIEGSVSSQYISALLLVLPLLEGDSEIRLLSPLASAPYVNMTLDTMKHFGVSVTQNEKGFYIPGGQRYLSPGEIWVEGDWSSASALLAAGFMSERGITVKGLDSESFQGDKKIAELLSLWGGEVSYGDNVYYNFYRSETEIFFTISNAPMGNGQGELSFTFPYTVDPATGDFIISGDGSDGVSDTIILHFISDDAFTITEEDGDVSTFTRVN